jgi:hypothetical protein
MSEGLIGAVAVGAGAGALAGAVVGRSASGAVVGAILGALGGGGLALVMAPAAAVTPATKPGCKSCGSSSRLPPDPAARPTRPDGTLQPPNTRSAPVDTASRTAAVQVQLDRSRKQAQR